MHPTRVTIPSAKKKKLVELLNARLADSLDLYGQAKHAHWNVTGPSFIALHELFDKIAGDVSGFADELAERSVQLGGIPSGLAADFAKASSLSRYPGGPIRGERHVQALADAVAAAGGLVRDAIDAATKLADADTADLFTEISRGLDKHVWLLEAHLR